MLRVSIFLLGFILSVVGLFFIFLYLNLFVIGYSFFDFVYFIIRNIYCDLFFIGILLILVSLGRLGKK